MCFSVGPGYDDLGRGRRGRAAGPWGANWSGNSQWGNQWGGAPHGTGIDHWLLATGRFLGTAFEGKASVSAVTVYPLLYFIQIVKHEKAS